MIHHGAADADVPLEWSERANSVLQAAGKNTTLHVYPEGAHEFIKEWPLVMQRTTEFFDEHVKNKAI